MRTDKFNFRINHQIRTPEVRVIGIDGKQIGVMKLSQALDKAQEKGLDLVEIAPNAKPPVAKIVELGKFMYEQEKRLQKLKKKAKGGELKEVRLSPFIAQHDYQVRLQKIKQFLDEKNKVKVTVVFMGRQMNSKKFGYDLLDRVLSDLEESVVVDGQPKFIGRHLAMIVSPTTKSKKEETTKNPKH